MKTHNMLVHLSKQQWIERYGGQEILDREGFDVVPCIDCDDSICHGWKVVPKPKQTSSKSLQILIGRHNWDRITNALIHFSELHPDMLSGIKPQLHSHTLFIMPQHVEEFFGILLG